MAIPFDSTGTLPSNRKGEEWTVSAVNGVNNNYFVPQHAPFHSFGVVVWDKITGQPLEPGTDYGFTYLFDAAKNAIGKDIYGGIYLIDPARTGKFGVSVASIGGDFTNSEQENIQSGMKVLAELLTITWDEVVPADMTFPPTAHTQPYTDVQAVGEIMARIIEVTEAIKSGSRNIHMNDIMDLDSSYVTPLMTRLSAIRDAILTKANATSVYHEYTTTKNVNVSVGAQPEGVWFALPLFVTPFSTGTYEIRHGVTILDISGSNDFTYQVRYVIDGQPRPQSYDNGSIIPLDAGTVVSLQCKLIGRGGNVTIATSESSSFISAKKLSI